MPGSSDRLRKKAVRTIAKFVQSVYMNANSGNNAYRANYSVHRDTHKTSGKGQFRHTKARCRYSLN